MAVMNNRETFLKTEPEMDITQFAKTELDLAYAMSHRTRFWIFFIRKTEKAHIRW